MTVSPLTSRRRLSAGVASTPSAAKIAQVQLAAARARRLQGERISQRVIEVLPAMAEVLPDHGLKAGATYSVDGSSALISALLAGPSSDGQWCGIVGMPGFAAEAAARLGCDLEHVVFVPRPGRDWVNVVAALVDALTVVVVRPTGSVSEAEAARLSARLRQRESVLIACGTWPRPDARLSVTHSDWLGLGSGRGHLTARRAMISVSGRGVRRRTGPDPLRGRGTRVWLPDSTGQIRLAGDATAFTDHLPPEAVIPELREAAG